MPNFRVGKSGSALASDQVADCGLRPVLDVIVQGHPVARLSSLHVSQDLHAARGTAERHQIPWIGTMDTLVVRAANESGLQALRQTFEGMGVARADAPGAAEYQSHYCASGVP